MQQEKGRAREILRAGRLSAKEIDIAEGRDPPCPSMSVRLQKCSLTKSASKRATYCRNDDDGVKLFVLMSSKAT